MPLPGDSVLICWILYFWQMCFFPGRNTPVNDIVNIPYDGWNARQTRRCCSIHGQANKRLSRLTIRLTVSELRGYRFSDTSELREIGALKYNTASVDTAKNFQTVLSCFSQSIIFSSTQLCIQRFHDRCCVMSNIRQIVNQLIVRDNRNISVSHYIRVLKILHLYTISNLPFYEYEPKNI